MSSYNEEKFQKEEVREGDETHDKQTDTPADPQDALAASHGTRENRAQNFSVISGPGREYQATEKRHTEHSGLWK
ncbi:hypothetical protein F8M41_025808 [Gigaspora margarita]|uniref:Uncharacterized protein n=1 Tax=Gigaspora margarita TaxID=4874 RepID=A0A8H4ET66_GIGMA|nr:hypothetical protein F8M41_025808 [Gigaspora margarita]